MHSLSVSMMYTILYDVILSYTALRDASAIVAQLVEQRIRNAWVAGSSPASGSRIANHLSMVRYFFCIIKKKVLPLQTK